MIITTLSGKDQTTFFIEFIKALGLEPGTRLKQSLEGKRIFIEPIEDVMMAFGSLSGKGMPCTIWGGDRRHGSSCRKGAGCQDGLK